MTTAPTTAAAAAAPKFACRVPDCDARRPVPAPVPSPSPAAGGEPEGRRVPPPLCAACWGLLHPAEQRMYAEGDLSDAGVVTAASFRRALARAKGRVTSR